ncbi:MAG: hypothetical protein ACFCUO_06985, partial [Rhodospirillales bacterium]
HRLAAIAGIERLTKNKPLADDADDTDAAAAVERPFERLSVASRHLPSSLEDECPDIPWRAVLDRGKVLRHACDQVIDERTWRVVERVWPAPNTAVPAIHESLPANRAGWPAAAARHRRRWACRRRNAELRNQRCGFAEAGAAVAGGWIRVREGRGAWRPIQRRCSISPISTAATAS